MSSSRDMTFTCILPTVSPSQSTLTTPGPVWDQTRSNRMQELLSPLGEKWWCVWPCLAGVGWDLFWMVNSVHACQHNRLRTCRDHRFWVWRSLGICDFREIWLQLVHLLHSLLCTLLSPLLVQCGSNRDPTRPDPLFQPSLGCVTLQLSPCQDREAVGSVWVGIQVPVALPMWLR